jgi:GxxExxY protein
MSMSKLVIDTTGNDLTYRIIGAAMAVHNRLGPGYKEEVYERALALQMNSDGIAVQRQFEVEVVDEGAVVALFIIDIFVESTVVVECKAFSHGLTADDIAQVINYLKATGISVGILLNFGRRKLEFRRIFPPSSIPASPQRLGRDNVKRANLPDPP